MHIEKSSTSFPLFSVRTNYLVVRYTDLCVGYMGFKPVFSYRDEGDEDSFVRNMIFNKIIEFPMASTIDTRVQSSPIQYEYLVYARVDRVCWNFLGVIWGGIVIA